MLKYRKKHIKNQKEEVPVMDINIKGVINSTELKYLNYRSFYTHTAQAIDNTDDQEIALDFHGIEIVDAVALGTLVSLLKRARKQNKEVELKNVSPAIFDLLTLLRFDSMFQIQVEGGE